MLFGSLILILLIISILLALLTVYKEQKKELIKTVFFYGAWNCFVISCLKVYVGDARLTIWESFSQIWLRSLLHYGVMMFAASFMMYIFCKYMLKQRAYVFIAYEASSLFATLGVYYLIIGKITNIAYCIFWMMSFVIAVLICFLKKKPYCNGLINIKKYCKKNVPVITFVFISNIIFVPCELYLSNTNEFLFHFGIILSLF